MIFDLSKKDEAIKNMYKDTLDIYKEYLMSDEAKSKMFKDASYHALETSFTSVVFTFVVLGTASFGWMLCHNFTSMRTFVFAIIACVGVGIISYFIALAIEINKAKARYSDIEYEYDSIRKSIDTFISSMLGYKLTLDYKHASSVCSCYNNILKCEGLVQNRVLSTYIDTRHNIIEFRLADSTGAVLSDELCFSTYKENVDVDDDMIVLDEDGYLNIIKKVIR